MVRRIAHPLNHAEHSSSSGSEPRSTSSEPHYTTSPGLVILERSVLERHALYINDNATRENVQSPLNQAIEFLDKLDKENYFFSNCARFIARLSQSQSDQG